jgi:DNA processing protein
MVAISDPRYPSVLRRKFGSNAPAVLFCRGAIDLLTAISVGFCGSRKASERGLEVAADCASQLSEAGINVVSGYAAGIDLTTHIVALREGGTTTIVLPEGIEHFRIRRDLRDIWDWSRVLVISQFNPSMPWRVENAMKRNIIICALSRALIVVEAGRTGGSIEAGRVALAADIPVYAPVYDGMPETAAGNVELFVKGAKRILKSKSTERAKMNVLFEQVVAPSQTSLFGTLSEG